VGVRSGQLILMGTTRQLAHDSVKKNRT
jgi:hypothetical protein